MGLLQKLLSTLGLRESSTGRGSERAGETTVTVEHEPDTSSESAVKGTEGVADDTSASGSTATITDTADEDVGAAEPSDAAGPSASAHEENLDEGAPTEDADADTASEDFDEDTVSEDSDDDATVTDQEETPADVEDAPAGTEDEPSADIEEAESDRTADETTGEDEPDDAADATGEAGSSESPDVLNGIGPAYAERLEDAGVDTVAELATADAADLADETGLGEGRIANWIEQAKEY